MDNLRFYSEYTIELDTPFVADQKDNRRLLETSPVYNGIEVSGSDHRVVDSAGDEEFIREMNARPGARATKLQLKEFDPVRDFSHRFDDVAHATFTPRVRMRKGDVFRVFDTNTAIRYLYDGQNTEGEFDGAGTTFTATSDGSFRLRCNAPINSGETHPCRWSWNGTDNYLWIYRDPTSVSELRDDDNKIIGNVEVGGTIMFEPFTPPGGPSTNYMNQTFSGVPANRLRRANPGTAIPATGTLELIVNDQLITTFDVADLRAIRTYPNGRQFGALSGRYLSFVFEGVTHYLAWHNATTLFYGNSVGTGSWHVVLKDLSHPARNFTFNIADDNADRISWNRAGNDVVVYGLSRTDERAVRLYINGNPIDNTSAGVRKMYDITVVGGYATQISGRSPVNIDYPEQIIQGGETTTFDILDWIQPYTATTPLPTITAGTASVVRTAMRRGTDYAGTATVFLDVIGLATTTEKTTTLKIAPNGTTEGVTLNFRVIPALPFSLVPVQESYGLLDPYSLPYNSSVIMHNQTRNIDLREYFWWEESLHRRGDIRTGKTFREIVSDLSSVTIRSTSNDRTIVDASISGTDLILRALRYRNSQAGTTMVTLEIQALDQGSGITYMLTFSFDVTVLNEYGQASARTSLRSNERIAPLLITDPFLTQVQLQGYPTLDDNVLAEQHGVIESIRMNEGGSFHISEKPKALEGNFKLQHINTSGHYYKRSNLLEIADGNESRQILLKFPVSLSEA